MQKANDRITELLGDEEEKLEEFKQQRVIIYIIYEPLVVLADTTYKEADSEIAGKIHIAQMVTIMSWLPTRWEDPHGAAGYYLFVAYRPGVSLFPLLGRAGA